MPRISKVEKLTNARNAIAGLNKRFTKRSGYLIAGKQYSPRALVALFPSHLDAIRAADAARAALTAAVRNEQALARRVTAMTTALRLKLASEYGVGADIWGDFGWEPPKAPGPKTVAAKAEGVRKRQAARKPNKKR